jgi:hypothetical protein
LSRFVGFRSILGQDARWCLKGRPFPPKEGPQPHKSPGINTLERGQFRRLSSRVSFTSQGREKPFPVAGGLKPKKDTSRPDNLGRNIFTKIFPKARKRELSEEDSEKGPITGIECLCTLITIF